MDFWNVWRVLPTSESASFWRGEGLFPDIPLKVHAACQNSRMQTVAVNYRAYGIPLLVATSLAAANSMNVKELTLEYKPTLNGGRQAVVHNLHGAAATAYLAEAYVETADGQRLTSFGGDALEYPDGGGIEVPAKTEKAMPNSLPPGYDTRSTGFMVAVYADGFTEGDEDIVAMILSGRQRALSDLNECLPKLEKAAAGAMTAEELSRQFEAMRSRDRAQAATLDGMTARSGVRYRYFMTAVPDHALEALTGFGRSDLSGLAKQFRDWRVKLQQSKPGLG